MSTDRAGAALSFGARMGCLPGCGAGRPITYQSDSIFWRNGQERPSQSVHNAVLGQSRERLVVHGMSEMTRMREPCAIALISTYDFFLHFGFDLGLDDGLGWKGGAPHDDAMLLVN